MKLWIESVGVALVLAAATPAHAQSEGQLVIASTPPGAQISVDGKALGKAPAIAKGLLPGEHVIQADWGDGRQQTMVQKVQPGASQVVQVSAPGPVVPSVGTLVVVSDPSNAEITVDGKALGKAPQSAQSLVVGDHAVVARWPNGQTATGTGHVQANTSGVLLLKMPAVTAAPVIAPPPAAPTTPPPSAAPPAAAPPPVDSAAPAAPVATPPASSSTTPPGAPPPEGAPPTGTAPAPLSTATGEATPSATPAAQAEVTQPAPPPRRKKWVVPVVVGVVVGVVVIGVAVGLGVGLSGGNSRYGIAEF